MHFASVGLNNAQKMTTTIQLQSTNFLHTSLSRNHIKANQPRTISDHDNICHRKCAIEKRFSEGILTISRKTWAVSFVVEVDPD
jgi:hypothetical protein